MVRTQIYLTEREREALASLAESTGKKQSELIREAVDRFLDESSAAQRRAAIRRMAGMWKGRKDLPDFKTLRREWDRR